MLDEVIAKLRELSERHAKSPRLPTVAEIEAVETRLGTKFHPDYVRYLLEAGDLAFDWLEPATIAEDSGRTSIFRMAGQAWADGMPRDLVPIAKDDAEYYGIDARGGMHRWSCGGSMNEQWPDLATWVEEVRFGKQPMDDQMAQNVAPIHFMGSMEVASLDGDRFHIFRDGEDALMLSCYTDLVVSAELGALLARRCPGQLEVSPAVIEQIATGETRPGYCVLRGLTPITLDNIDALDVKGDHVWAFNDHYLFVSPTVARALRDAFPGRLDFSNGFSQFAA